MALLVVTVARKLQTTQTRHGKRLAGESAIEGGRQTSLRSRWDFERKQLANAGADVVFLRLFLKALPPRTPELEKAA